MRALFRSFVHCVLPGKTKFLLVCALLLSACVSHQKLNFTPPPLQAAGPSVQIADVDVLALSPAMEAFLERYILPYSNMETRLRLLTLAVTSTGVLGFDYDEARTLTASEAFETRSGNCIGFANMMITLARRAGLKARYQEVLMRPEWVSHEDTVLLIKHINVAIENPRYSYIVDVSGVDIDPDAHRRLIVDTEARALYYNNIGVQALLENKLPLAHANLVKAISLGSGLTDPWINLGVVYGRNEQLQAAELAQRAALQINARDYSAMSNLYEIYLAQEDFSAAQQLEARVEKYRQKNPYYLMKLADEAREQARFDDSISLLQRAISKKQNDHLLYFALAKTQYLSGQTEAAGESLRSAQELAPQDMLAYYARPLRELVLE